MRHPPAVGGAIDTNGRRGITRDTRQVVRLRVDLRELPRIP